MVALKTLIALSAAATLVGCDFPDANIDSEYFRAEYEAATDALVHHGGRSVTSLGELHFYIASSQEEVQTYCSSPPCRATYLGLGHIVLPPLPQDDDYCGWIKDRETGSMKRYASTVIHEILHAQGLDHDTDHEARVFDLIETTGWITFAHRMCPEVFDSFRIDIASQSVDWGVY